MREYEACNWCQIIIFEKKAEIRRYGANICSCGEDLSMRCSACIEQHNEECPDNDE